MKALYLLPVLLWFPADSVVVAQQNNQPPKGFRALFNGTDMKGWQGLRTMDPYQWNQLDDAQQQAICCEDQLDMLCHWCVGNGQIVNDGQGVFLSTREHFQDFELWVDYKTVAGADSGIYLKGCPQVQIWDWTEAGGKWELGADKGSGGLWNNRAGSPGKDPMQLADKPFGQWNRFRIRQIGARTSVWLNDCLVVDGALMENIWPGGRPLPPRGPIQLQTHGGEICWRNIFVREIGPDEALLLLAELDAADGGFETVFDGKTFEGWSGPTENYEIVDRAIRCRPGHGGTIFTEHQYDDFSAAIQFRLPPGGNNGLAIRYPGDGDTAYEGMCELQVLDNDSAQYADLDPRQFHGSAYGMVAAHRGYLRPAGVWNYQRVTVRGSTIQVELNGNLILETDLATVETFMHDSPHPGKDRRSGHFGFAGHGDAVEFRDIRIKRLMAAQ